MQTTPTLTVCGATDAELRTLIEVLVHAILLTDTAQPEAPTSGIPVYLRTFDEHTSVASAVADILPLLPHTDLVLWVVGFDTRALANDRAILENLRTNFPDLPLLIVANAIDRVSPIFTPAHFSLETPTSEAERAVSAWLEELTHTFAAVNPSAILPCAVGAGPKDVSRHYNLPALSARIESLLPHAKRVRWIAEEKVSHDVGEKADKMILAATTAAGAIGLLPMPIADMPFIVATQVALIISICSLYGKAFTADAARSLVLAALSALAGPIAFQNIVKVVPGLGSVVGGGVAAACTYAVGKATKVLAERNTPFGVSTFLNAVKTAFKDYRDRKKEEK